MFPFLRNFLQQMNSASTKLGLESYQKEKVKLWRKLNKRNPNLSDPRTFSEKLLKRCMFCKDPYYYLYGTKINAPFFLQSCFPNTVKTIKRLGVYKTITPSQLLNLPSESFILKSSWGSGVNFIVNDKYNCNLDKICSEINKKSSLVKNSHKYQDPYNCIVAEELIGNVGEAIDDFKFHCIRDVEQNNKIVVQHYTRMSDGARRQKAYDINFEKLGYSISKFEEYEENFPKPRLFEKAVNIAHHLSRGFDYIRVDLYILEDEIYFGEYTPYHAGGITKVTSEKHDEILGKHWLYREISFDPTAKTGKIIE